MTNPKSPTTWPDYLPLPHDDVFAIGVIALNYCQLENMLKGLFSSVTRMNHYQTAALFHRMANNVRKDVLLDLLAKTTIPPELREHIEHFQKGFSICADNRHGIMHSSSAGVHSGAHSRGLILKRYSRAGAELECYLTLNDLRQVADEIHTFMAYGAWVIGDTTNYAERVAAKTQDQFRVAPATSRGKPPLPIPLNWHSADAPKGPHNQLFALDLISPFRIRTRPGESPAEGEAE